MKVSTRIQNIGPPLECGFCSEFAMQSGSWGASVNILGVEQTQDVVEVALER